jgi:RNA polymerase sigma-70 factor (ECF subfamily)
VLLMAFILWPAYCLIHRRLVFQEFARSYGIMETAHISEIYTDKDPDGALVSATKGGDTLAFETLVSRYKRRALAMAQRITNNREDAEDVVQEGFHKAFLHLSAFQEKSRFSTWLTRIVMNEAFMLLRRRRGVPEVLPESPEDRSNADSLAFVDHNPSPEESCWLRERSELLNKAISRLGPRTRKTVMLRDMEGHSLEETAQILGTSVGAVKSRLFHGRQKLRGTVNPGALWGLYTEPRMEAQAGGAD